MFSTTMTPGRTGPWPKIPPTRAPSSAPGPSPHTQFWAAYTTGMRESNFRYTQDIQHHRAADYLRRTVEITKGILHRRRLRNLTSRLKPIYSDNALIATPRRWSSMSQNQRQQRRCPPVAIRWDPGTMTATGTPHAWRHAAMASRRCRGATQPIRS